MIAAKRLRMYMFLFLSIITMYYFYTISDDVLFIFCLATAISMYFLTQDVLSIYNDSILNSKMNAFANSIGLGVALICRYGIVHFEMSIKFLALPIIIVSLIPFLIRRSYFNSRNKSLLVNKKRRYIKYMFLTGLPLAISGVSISVYTQLSQILLAKFSTIADLGIFSAANTLAASWSFIAVALIRSNFSVIYKIKKNDKAINETAKLNGIVLLFCILVVAGISVFGKYILTILYGEQYHSAYPIMVILSVSTAFSAMGPVAYRYIIKQAGHKFLSYKTIAVTVLNVCLCLFLIPKYQMLGAAISMLITEFFSLTIFNYFYNKGEIAKIHFKTFDYRIYSQDTQENNKV